MRRLSARLSRPSRLFWPTTSALALGAAFTVGTLSPLPAHADDTTAVGGTLGSVRATENDGFGDLKWGADLKAVYGRYPELKKLYPQAKIAGLIKTGQQVVVETRVQFKGVAYPGKLVVDQDGLARVTIEVKVEEGAEAVADKALDPILGDLSTPDDETPEMKIWKGSSTVVVVTRTREVGRVRLDIAFHAKNKYRAESAGGSLGIE